MIFHDLCQKKIVSFYHFVNFSIVSLPFEFLWTICTKYRMPNGAWCKPNNHICNSSFHHPLLSDLGFAQPCLLWGYFLNKSRGVRALLLPKDLRIVAIINAFSFDCSFCSGDALVVPQLQQVIFPAQFFQCQPPYTKSSGCVSVSFINLFFQAFIAQL